MKICCYKSDANLPKQEFKKVDESIVYTGERKKNYYESVSEDIRNSFTYFDKNAVGTNKQNIEPKKEKTLDEMKQDLFKHRFK